MLPTTAPTSPRSPLAAQCNVSMPKPMAGLVDEMCRVRGLTRSAFVREAVMARIAYYLENHCSAAGAGPASTPNQA